jgi:hypothetical protein
LRTGDRTHPLSESPSTVRDQPYASRAFSNPNGTPSSLWAIVPAKRNRRRHDNRASAPDTPMLYRARKGFAASARRTAALRYASFLQIRPSLYSTLAPG